MPLPFPDCRLFHPAAPRNSERPADKELIFLLPLIHQGHDETLHLFLKTYINSFRGQTDVSLVLYMPEPYYELETLEQLLEAEGTPETQPDIEIILDPMLVSAEPELYLNADVVIALEVDTALILKVLALNRKMFCFGDLPAALPFERWVQKLENANLTARLQQLYTERKRSPYSRPWVLKQKQQQLLAASKGRPLLYVPSQRHLEHLKNRYNQALILTDDFETFYQLENQDEPCLMLQDFLDLENKCHSNDLASNLAKTWHKDAFDIQYKQQNIIENCQYDLWYAFRGCLNTAEALSKIIQLYEPRSFILFDELTQAHFWDPASGPSPDPQNAIFAFLAEENQIPWQKIAPPPRGPIRSQSQSRITPLEHQGQWFIDINSIQNLKLKYKHIILGIGSHIDLEEQGLLADNLWNRDDTLYLFLRTYPFPIQHKNAFFLDINFFLVHPDLEQDLQHVKHLLHTTWQNGFKSENTKTPLADQYPVLFKNNYLHFQFEQFFNQVIESMRYIYAAHYLIDLLSPDMCLFGNTVSGSMRGFLKVFKSHNIPTLSIMHARNIHPEYWCPPDIFCVKGQDLKSIFEKRSPSTQVEVIGDLRKPKDRTKVSSVLHREMNDLLQKKKSRSTILLLTSAISYGLHLGIPTNIYSEAWNEVITVIKKHPEWFFIIKIHPRYDHPEFYKQVKQETNNLFLADPGLSYSDLQSHIDICLMVSRYSTVFYEVYASSKPLILVSDTSEATAPCKIPAQQRIIEQTIFTLLNNSLEKQSLIDEQINVLQSEWYSQNGYGHQYVESLIEQKLSQTSNKNLTQSSKEILMLAHGFNIFQLTNQPNIWDTARTISNLSKVDISYYNHILQRK